MIRSRTIAYRVIRLWWRVARPRTLGARVLIVDAEGRVLLIRHTYRRGWHLPGGGVRRAESFEAAARREAREEVGVILGAPLELLGMYYSDDEGKFDHIAVYVARVWEGTPTSDRKEIAETAWLSSDADPPVGLSSWTRRWLEDLAGPMGENSSAEDS
ncbi:MAG TPA: NUDIX domain-containing protein [Acidimicrobiia bacterium]|nr:NUDIX domain-containing protein [Acidimicrobiia bacterium]